MARTVRDSILDTRTARARLKPRGKPYSRAIDPGLHLGYGRSADGVKWVVRVYLGSQAYRLENIATADDCGEADGHTVAGEHFSIAGWREEVGYRLYHFPT